MFVCFKYRGNKFSVVVNLVSFHYSYYLVNCNRKHAVLQNSPTDIKCIQSLSLPCCVVFCFCFAAGLLYPQRRGSLLMSVIMLLGNSSRSSCKKLIPTSVLKPSGNEGLCLAFSGEGEAHLRTFGSGLRKFLF